ncbi:MAG: isoleucine--tRNA ligase, partial [Thermoleophilia bacterium]|nr:isoleucine--tRNA ligase [Thermoleophilia bacterium]
TLKDVFQRYKALRGFDQRYQNGFDCQGLWVEVEVEKALGLDSKREIEEYGLAEFAERCKERVALYAGVITEQSQRLGMWMDWRNSYYTFSDTNIEYIWRFLKVVHERGWLYKGHRSTEWCPRCGTSISQHELHAGEYVELEHPSLYVRLPLLDREGESLVVWTTTPWTLPANVAAAVAPDAEYGRRGNGEWVAVDVYPDASFAERRRGADLVGWRYAGPFDDLPAQAGVEHRVIPWDEVALDEGTGIVHIAPGAGSEDFELGRVHGLPVLAPIDEGGRMVDGYGAFAGLSTDDVAEPVAESLRDRGLLVEAGRIVHRYPTCWRCKTPLVFRVVDDWFVAADELRRPMLDANATVDWQPPQYKKRMDDWLRNLGDWNISRKRYFGLPLPFYECGCGHLTVVGSRAELAERAVDGIEQLRELHRPWIDAVRIRCERCGEPVERIPEVGDAWLDAGIVPFSTLGWGNETAVEAGNGTGAAAGLTGADLPDRAYWETWFPADWVSEMREQLRLWFYSQSFMSVALTGRSPYRRVLTYEKLLDETGREMHRSWGNAIEANEALERMGADVMRWLFAEIVPSQNMRFGYGPAEDVKRRLLTLWNSARFFADYGRIEGFEPEMEDLDAGPVDAELAALDRWLLARVQALVGEAAVAYEAYWTPGVARAFEAFVEDLSNWYIRRSRRRFYGEDDAAFRTLWYALAQGLRVIAPVLPFLAEHLWSALGGRDSVFLAGWPAVDESLRDEALLAEMAEVRELTELGRRARDAAGLKLRQPLRRAVVAGSGVAARWTDEIRDELRVKEVELSERPDVRASFKPHLPVLGPRLGKELPAVREALARREVEELGDGRVRAAGHELGPEELIVERHSEPGWAHSERFSVWIDTELDEELRREGRVLDLIRQLNELRRQAGLELTDRIVVRLPSQHADLLEQHEDWIKDEVLAVRIEVDGAEPSVEKAP